MTTSTPPSEPHGSPLDALVVVDLTVARAGPTGVRYLADWGADVLRVESRDLSLALMGDHASADYLNLHRSKQMMQLDLRVEPDRERLYQNVERDDVIV